jgi:hypothetical protein
VVWMRRNMPQVSLCRLHFIRVQMLGRRARYSVEPLPLLPATHPHFLNKPLSFRPCRKEPITTDSTVMLPIKAI